MVKQRRILKNVLITIVIIALISAYPIYAIIIWNLSKSPSPFSDFPTNGVYVCNEKNFTITLNLEEVGEEGMYENTKANLSFNNQSYNLSVYNHGGHGTPLFPAQPSEILGFRCTEQNCVTGFSTSKYKINSNNFYLLDISVSKNNNLEFIKNGMDLYFVKIES